MGLSRHSWPREHPRWSQRIAAAPWVTWGAARNIGACLVPHPWDLGNGKNLFKNFIAFLNPAPESLFWLSHWVLLFKCEQIMLKQLKNDQKSLFSWSLTQFSANCLTKAFENVTKTTMNYTFRFLDSLGMEAACNPVLLLLMLLTFSSSCGKSISCLKYFPLP